MQVFLKRSCRLVSAIRAAPKKYISQSTRLAIQSHSFKQLIYSGAKFSFASDINSGDNAKPGSSNDDEGFSVPNSDDDDHPAKPASNSHAETYSIKPLQSIPVKSFKDTNLSEEEKKMKPETFLLFSAQQPILPYTSVPCQLRTGSLKDIDYTLAYFLQNEEGDVYMVGLQLESNVQSELMKQFKKDQ